MKMKIIIEDKNEKYFKICINLFCIIDTKYFKYFCSKFRIIFNQLMKSSDYYAAKDLIKKGDNKEAIQILKALEKQTPKNPDVQNYIGFSYRKLGNLNLAAIHYN